MLAPWKKRYDQLGRHIKKQRHCFSNKVLIVKAVVFLVVMYACELDHKEGWAQKNWCFWTVVLEKTLESPLDCKELKPVSPKGNQSWIFIGRTDAETEVPIFWPLDAKSRLFRKDSDDRKYWRQEEWQRMRWLDGITDLITWVWASSRRWWRKRKAGLLQSMGLQRIRHDWATERQQIILNEFSFYFTSLPTDLLFSQK